MKKVIAACMIGNALEWYDFALYGHFAVIISKLFFPGHDYYVGMIATYTIFAAGFLMRPLGGVIFGYIGDRYGRRVSLAISIMMMALPTACIGLLPTYNSIGIWAPILLSIIRLIQGVSIGGEFSGCIAFLVECAPINRRGLVGSASMVSLAGGMLLGSLTATAVSSCMSIEAFETWGWRIPFIVGILIGLIGIYVRLGLHESPLYLEAKKSRNLSKKPVRELIDSYMMPLALAVGIYLTVTVPFYTLTIFVKSYMLGTLQYSNHQALVVNIVTLVVLVMIMPIGAYLSDLYGRKRILRYSSLALMIFIYPIFWFLVADNFYAVLFGQVIFALILGMYMGPVPAVLVELFPTRVRFSGVALSYNMSAALFGGTAPLVATWLVTQTRQDAVAMYIILFIMITLIALRKYQETYRKELV